MKRAIFGAGANGRLFLQGMELSGVTVDAFIDQTSMLSEVDGVPVLKPDV
ncbi:MAG: hypothetical protein HN382_00045, partial [Gammaproteobacteria bacterium]|jgi:hypothetical protein|nr:hypothetical protein [Gammaproteobacteria bacterium]